MIDFKIEQVILKRPDGTGIIAHKYINLPEGEKGEISKFLEEKGNIKMTSNLTPIQDVS